MNRKNIRKVIVLTIGNVFVISIFMSATGVAVEKKAPMKVNTQVIQKMPAQVPVQKKIFIPKMKPKQPLQVAPMEIKKYKVITNPQVQPPPPPMETTIHPQVIGETPPLPDPEESIGGPPRPIMGTVSSPPEEDPQESVTLPRVIGEAPPAEDPQGRLGFGEVLQRPPCFIATAAYGTPLAEEIGVLSDFRDEFLLQFSLGRGFVETYYATSPPLAAFIAEHEVLRMLTRAMLWPIVFSISHPASVLIFFAVFMVVITISSRRRSAKWLTSQVS